MLVAGGGAFLQWRKSAPAPQATTSTSDAQHIEIARTDITVLEAQRLQQGLPISGTLRAVQSAVVKARVAGELLDLQVREGDSVQAGQVLARIDPTEFQRRVRQAEEQAEAARAQIDIAQRQFDNNRALVDQGFISKTALQTSQATLAGAHGESEGVKIMGRTASEWLVSLPTIVMLLLVLVFCAAWMLTLPPAASCVPLSLTTLLPLRVMS